MLPLSEADRVRILAAVARKGGLYPVRRVVVITLSLLVLLAVPLTGLARVDLWGGEHRVLGRPATAVEALQGIVISLAVLYGVTFLTNMLFGRFFCGWGCPVGYVSRLGEDVDLKSGRPARKYAAHLAGAGFVATFIGAVLLWWVDPRVLLEGSWTARGVVAGTFLALCFGGFLHAFVWRFGFCLHACPIGLYYRYVTSRAPAGIVFSNVPDPCIECGACTTVCPVRIEPRKLGELLPSEPRPDGSPAEERYGDAECLRCGDCVEACRMVFLPRRGATPPLRFGFVPRDGSVGAPAHGNAAHDAPAPTRLGSREEPAHPAAKLDAGARSRFPLSPSAPEPSESKEAAENGPGARSGPPKS